MSCTCCDSNKVTKPFQCLTLSIKKMLAEFSLIPVHLCSCRVICKVLKFGIFNKKFVCGDWEDFMCKEVKVENRFQGFFFCQGSKCYPQLDTENGMNKILVLLQLDSSSLICAL